jgi:hypothetical protein
MTSIYMYNLAISTGMSPANAGQISSIYQIRSFGTGLVNESQAMQLTSFFQYDAIVSGLEFEKALASTNGFIETALLNGVPINIATQITNEGQITAATENTKALANNQPAYFTMEQLLQITNSVQATGVISTNMTFNQAMQLTSHNQIAAYKKGVPFEKALKIETIDQYQALNLGVSPDLACLITSNSQLKALERGISPDLALNFTTRYQISAYDKCYNVNTALNINTETLLSSYNCPVLFYTAKNAGMPAVYAGQVTHYYQIQAFQLGSITAPQAIQIKFPSQYDALLSGLSFDKAILATNNIIEYALLNNVPGDLAVKLLNVAQVYAVTVNMNAEENHRPSYFSLDQILQITNSVQVDGFKNTNMTFNQALQLSSPTQIAAYIRGVPFEKALKIVFIEQFTALTLGATADQAINFNSSFQIMALRNNIPVDKSLLFNSFYQVQAYDKCHNVDQAINIQSSDALNNYTCSVTGEDSNLH